MTAKCVTPDCPNNAVARGLCIGHYRRAMKGDKSKTPLRPRGLIRISVRLRPETVEALKRPGPTAPIAARTALEDWAAKRRP